MLFIFLVIANMQENSPSKTWRMQNFKYRFLGSVCKKCKKYYYPYRYICSNCKSTKNIKDFIFKPQGKIISWSQIFAAPSGYEKYVPYIIALVELEKGVKVLSQICDCDVKDLKVGYPVEAVLRRLILPDEENVIKYGLKFRPANW